MSNPWLKKNPFMSMWLSGANTVANSARGQMAAEAKRQTSANASRVADDIVAFWFGISASRKPAARKTKRRRSAAGR